MGNPDFPPHFGGSLNQGFKRSKSSSKTCFEVFAGLQSVQEISRNDFQTSLKKYDFLNISRFSSFFRLLRSRPDRRSDFP